MNGRVAVIVITALMAFAALYTLFGCGKTKPEAFYPHQLYSRVDGSRDPDAGVDRFDRHVYPISARFSKHAAGAYGLPGSVSERRNIPGTKVRTGNNGVLFDDGLVSSENPVTYPDGTQVINYPPTFTVGKTESSSPSSAASKSPTRQISSASPSSKRPRKTAPLSQRPKTITGMMSS